MTQPEKSDTIVEVEITITVSGSPTTVLPAKRVTIEQYDAICTGLGLGIKAAAGLDGPKW